MAICHSTSNDEKESNKVDYKRVKKEARKAITLVKNKTFEKLYQRLDITDGGKDIFKLARMRETKTKHLGDTRCIKVRMARCLHKKLKLARDDNTTCLNVFAVMIIGPLHAGN